MNRKILWILNIRLLKTKRGAREERIQIDFISSLLHSSVFLSGQEQGQSLIEKKLGRIEQGSLGLEVLGTPAGCQLCFSTSSSGSPDCGDVGGLKGCDTGRRALRSQQMVTKPCMWEKAWSEGSAIWWGPGWMDTKEAVTGIGQNYQYPFKCAGTEWHF